MSKLNPDTTSTRPGTPCEPVQMTAFESVVTIKISEVSGLVQREVQHYLASLPFAHVTCITVKKAAELLQCFEDTVRVYIKSGQLTASRLGKDYRIRINDLDNFLIEKQTASIVRKMQHPRKKVS